MNTQLRIGDWLLDTLTGQLSRDGSESSRLDARTLKLLLYFIDRSGATVSMDELLDAIWPDVAVTQDSVYQAIASLRRQLADDPRQPTYIATDPRRGYRLVAHVQRVEHEATATRAPNHRKIILATALLAVFVVALGAFGWMRWHAAQAVAQPVATVAVLPFLDLTPGMKEEEFADGLTEELIGRLAHQPGLQVPSPTASFYLKDKTMTVKQMANALGVRYVIDGSIRSEAGRLRVSTRLVQAESGYVVWTENYDRAFDKPIQIQGDICTQIAQAVQKKLADNSR